MELGTGQDHLSLADTGIPGGADVDKLASSLKNISAGIRNKAKAKKAQGIADAGNYWTLSQFQKGLIPIPQYIVTQVAGQGITEAAVLSIREQGAGATNPAIIAKLKAISQGMSPDDPNLGTMAFATTESLAADAVKTANASTAPKVAAPVADKTKTYLMYGAIALAIGLVIYFLVKKH